MSVVLFDILPYGLVLENMSKVMLSLAVGLNMCLSCLPLWYLDLPPIERKGGGVCLLFAVVREEPPKLGDCSSRLRLEAQIIRRVRLRKEQVITCCVY